MRDRKCHTGPGNLFYWEGCGPRGVCDVGTLGGSKWTEVFDSEPKGWTLSSHPYGEPHPTNTLVLLDRKPFAGRDYKIVFPFIRRGPVTSHPHLSLSLTF